MNRQERLRTLKAHLERGKSPAEASRLMGVSRAAVSGLMGRNKEFFRGFIRTGTKPKGTKVAASGPIEQKVPPGELLPLRTLTQLGTNDCRFPIGSLYCGRTVTRGAYCATHGDKCYNHSWKGRAATHDMEPFKLPGAVRD